MADTFIKIPTDIQEGLYSYDFKKSHLRVLLYIERKTFGWRKREDRISMATMANDIGMTKRSVMRAIDELESMNVISVERSAGRPSKVGIRPVGEWQRGDTHVTSDTSVTSDTDVTTGVTPMSPQGVTPVSPTIDNNTDTYQKINTGSASLGDELTPEEEAELEAEGWF